MKTRLWILIAVVVGSFVGAYALKRSAGPPPAAPSGAERIVSLAPSTTETLFALGLGDRLVGVTRFCRFPPEAQAKPSIGGYYDPSYEAILQARPDLVVTLPEHEEVRVELRKLKLNVLTVDHRTLRGILESVTTLGAICGVPERATKLRSELESRVERVRARAAGPRPRVLISVGRMAGEGTVTRVTACGRGGFYDELVVLAGGVNAYEGSIPFPALSPEGVLALKPDVIIDLCPELDERTDLETIRREWRTIPNLAARVRLVVGSHSVVPGPRVVDLLDDFVRAIHD